MSEATPKQTGIGMYLVALVGALVIMVFLVRAMQQYTRPEPVDQKRAGERRQKLQEMRAADASALSSYGWQDQSKGIIRLPIARAMELTVIEAKDPLVARAHVLERLAKANAEEPKVPEKPSVYE